MVWWMVWRILLILLFSVGNLFLDNWLRRHFPPISKKFIPLATRPLIATGLLWGPTLWFIPGLLWLEILPLNFTAILGISLFLPFCVHLAYMRRRGLFDFMNPSEDRKFGFNPFDVVFVICLVPFLLPFTDGDLSRTLYVGFCLSLIIPAMMANALFRSSLPQLIPERIDDLDAVDLMEKMITGYYTTIPKPVWFIHDGKIETRIKGNAFMGSGASLLTTEPENLAGRKAGPQFVGINSPGTTMVTNGTMPSEVIDLRNQIRITRVECMTLDGIAVKVPVSSLFRIDWNTRMPKFQHAWPFSRPGVEMACISDLVDPNDKTPLEEQASHKWDDLPLFYARRALRRAVSYYTLDQLYGPSGSASAALIAIHNQVSMDLLGKPFNSSTAPLLTRQVIGKIIQAYVRNELAPRHYKILGGGVGNAIEPMNPMVTEQRIKAWKGRMNERILDWKGDVYERRYSQAVDVQEAALENFLNTLLNPASVGTLTSVDPQALQGLYLLRQLFQSGSRQDTEFLLDDEAYPSESWIKPLSTEEDEA